jgi:hypothetical protein
MAWLQAVPDEPEKKKIADKPEKVVERKSRRKRLDDEGRDIPMPPIASEYLIEHLLDVGPTIAGGMGESALSHAELRAYQQNTGVEFTPWEARTLRRLSFDYLQQSHESTKIDCPAPWVPDESMEREKVAKKVKGLFR